MDLKDNVCIQCLHFKTFNQTCRMMCQPYETKKRCSFYNHEPILYSNNFTTHVVCFNDFVSETTRNKARDLVKRLKEFRLKLSV